METHMLGSVGFDVVVSPMVRWARVEESGRKRAWLVEVTHDIASTML